MMHDDYGMGGWMPFGMGLWGLLVLIIAVLLIAVLIKILRR